MQNDYQGMKIDEVRTFQIDKDAKPNCRLPSQGGKIEIKIKKQFDTQKNVVFHTVKNDDDPFNDQDEEDTETYVGCVPGYVSQLRVVDDAQECGIGKMLMMLCFNEIEIHNVESNIENKALLKMEQNSKMAQKELQQKAAKLEKWVKTDCKKLLYLSMTAEPESNAHVYFNSAIESDFSLMFITRRVLSQGFYPKKCDYCSTDVLKKRYTSDGYMLGDCGIDGKDKTEVFGGAWFFCQPKVPTKIICNS